jgi:hypothetical protein
MGCTKALDFAAPPGAHLSFYWTMDEGGVSPKLDSTVGLAWPLIFAAQAAPGLFSNGLRMANSVLLNQNPGLSMTGTSIQINQTVSKGLSVWFWVNPSAYTFSFRFSIDDSGINTNIFRVTGGFTSALTGAIEGEHENNTDDVLVDSPNLTWALGTWHMVCLTYNKTAQTLNLYVDGALSASSPDTFTYLDLINSTMFLTTFAFLGGAVVGVSDELGLCLNGALTQAQITSLWNGGLGVTWPNITPIVPYP